MEIVENYQISTTTMAIVEEFNEDYNSIIYDRNGVYGSKQTIRKLLNDACIQRISTYDGRIQAIRKLFPYRKKTPIVICLHDRICAFPTTSPDTYGCSWIFPHHIQTGTVKDGQLFAVFKNGMQLPLSCSLHIFNRQRERTANCLNYFQTLLEEKSHYLH
ncbi:competence protein ComK [Bacillus thermotolerans]|uniref:competence protein ComK n=1 Tax=Bacillus thermotolerans TaxID=1221996 RepID=UPI000591D70D|nr:competence protein ComK [Bacillus thermotolerans]KKB44086.1 competence transcription factor [Bacillus thermotolerans]